MANPKPPKSKVAFDEELTFIENTNENLEALKNEEPKINVNTRFPSLLSEAIKENNAFQSLPSSKQDTRMSVIVNYINENVLKKLPPGALDDLSDEKIKQFFNMKINNYFEQSNFRSSSPFNNYFVTHIRPQIGIQLEKSEYYSLYKCLEDQVSKDLYEAIKNSYIENQKLQPDLIQNENLSKYIDQEIKSFFEEKKESLIQTYLTSIAKNVIHDFITDNPPDRLEINENLEKSLLDHLKQSPIFDVNNFLELQSQYSDKPNSPLRPAHLKQVLESSMENSIRQFLDKMLNSSQESKIENRPRR